MKKLTDEEIIKAVECCICSTSSDDCKNLNCPAYQELGCYFMDRSTEYYPESLIQKMGKSVLDLINRKDAEIERLNIELQSMRSTANSYKMHYEIAKSEVINEFEKEIKYVKENEKYDDFNPIVDIDLCENVLNSMKLQNEKIKKLNIKNKELSILINMQEKNIKEQ